MSISTTIDLPISADEPRTPASPRYGARAYFASDAVRAIQTVLGLVWLLDGAL